MRKIAFIFLLIFNFGFSQTEDKDQLKSIYDKALTDGKAYDWLNHLSNQIGGRLSGSVQAQQAVDYTKAELEKLGLDRVWLQPVMVPKWVRGLPEHAYIVSGNDDTINVPICALGGSVATPALGIKANVIEVQGIEDLEKLGRKKIEGKIVFYNRPMEPTNISTFTSYGGCVDQRYSGAAEAGKYGAVGVVVRSMSLRMDDYPHTGAMSYGDLPVDKRFPAAAISTNGVKLLSTALKLDTNTKFYFRQLCKQMKDVQSFNVIGEIKGSTYPNEIMVVGGHLDSWDLGTGAIDDASGCGITMAAAKLIKDHIGQPKRTIRVTLWANEENGLSGAKAYHEAHKGEMKQHIFGGESDFGAGTIYEFGTRMDEKAMPLAHEMMQLLKPLGIEYAGNDASSGADLIPMRAAGMAVFGLKQDGTDYFDYHHTANDTLDKIDPKELAQNVAAWVVVTALAANTTENFGFDLSDK